jgi:hypothetical protein
MTTITKNPLVSGIVVVVIVGVIVFIIKMRGSEEAFSHHSNEKIVENFPQSTPMNVMYSDSNGNLGTTTDLGLQNLTISSDGAMLLGNKFRFNGGKDAWKDDDWLRMMNKDNTGYYGGFASGRLYSEGDTTVGGNLSINSYGNVKDTLNDLYAKINALSGTVAALSGTVAALSGTLATLDKDSVKYSHKVKVWNDAYKAPLFVCQSAGGGGARGGCADNGNMNSAQFYRGMDDTNGMVSMRLIKV